MHGSNQFKKKVYLNAAKLGTAFLILSIGSSILGKYLDNKFNVYPRYSLTLFGISFIVSWVIVIIVLKNSKFQESNQNAQSSRSLNN